MTLHPGDKVTVADSIYWHGETEATVVLEHADGDLFVLVVWGGDGKVHAIPPDQVVPIP